MKLSFEWDEEKAKANLKNHRVGFDEDNRRTLPQDAQKGRLTRPQRVKGRGVPSGAHGATNKEHHVCARRRVVRRPGPR
jgi:uncharacterized DUF497 family protein